MLQAAARGALDLSRADPRDPAWRRRVSLTLYAVERDNLAQVHALTHARLVGLLGNGQLKEESFERLQADSRVVATRFKKLRFPWINFDPESDRAGAIARLHQLWIDTWGDPTAPEVQAKINATAQWLSRDQPTARRRRP